MVRGLFKGGVYFIQVEQENWYRSNLRVGRIQGNMVTSIQDWIPDMDPDGTSITMFIACM